MRSAHAAKSGGGAPRPAASSAAARSASRGMRTSHTTDGAAKYREALALDPSYVDGWHGLAMAFNELGRHQEAIEAGKKLCELTPDDVLAHTSLSRFYQAAGMVPEAEAEGAKARVLDWKRQLKEE